MAREWRKMLSVLGMIDDFYVFLRAGVKSAYQIALRLSMSNL